MAHARVLVLEQLPHRLRVRGVERKLGHLDRERIDVDAVEAVLIASWSGSAGVASVAASASLNETSDRRKFGVLTFAMLFAMTECAEPAPPMAFFKKPTVSPNEISLIPTLIGTRAPGP